jgi:hypothetical protein
MDMAAENPDHPAAALQSLAQARHAFPAVEMKAVRPNRHLKRWVVSENRDGFIRLGVDQADQTLDLLATKIAAALSRTKRVERDQAHRKIFDRIVDEFRNEIVRREKGGAQIGSIVLIAGQHINRGARLSEDRDSLRVFVLPSVMSDIADVNDHIRRRIKRVDVGDR